MKGKTTEIDLLMIHEKGIFVFESKNYSGWIFGSEDQLKWTQCFKSGQREHFYNPYKAESHTYQSFGDFPQYARRCLFFLYCIFGTMRTEKDSAIRWWRCNHSPKTEYAILFVAAFEGRADYLFSQGYWTSGWATGAVHRGFSRRKTTAYWGFTDQVSILW